MFSRAIQPVVSPNAATMSPRSGFEIAIILEPIEMRPFWKMDVG
jgi:hypothetical protein